MDIKHKIVSELKRIAHELGRTPDRDEFIAETGISKHQINTNFGGWTVLLKSQGLETNERKKRVTNQEFFYKEIRSQLQTQQEEKQQERTEIRKVSLAPKTSNVILCIGDCHFPFVCQESLSYVYQICEHAKPTHIIQIGDLYDMFSHGKFPRSRNTYNPFEEMKLGLEMAQSMWSKLSELAPKAQRIQLLGNHDIRPLKRIVEAYPEGEVFFSIDKYFNFDGVTHIRDYREGYTIDDWFFHHGYLNTLGAHRDFNMTNTCVGHSHKGGVVYKNINGKIIAELNCGYIGDPSTKALSYTAQKATHWTKGVGLIDPWGPRFIAF